METLKTDDGTLTHRQVGTQGAKETMETGKYSDQIP